MNCFSSYLIGIPKVNEGLEGGSPKFMKKNKYMHLVDWHENTSVLNMKDI